MKKKLKLNDLKVQSFITTEAADKLKGGSLETNYSCLRFATCDIVACVLTQQGTLCN